MICVVAIKAWVSGVIRRVLHVAYRTTCQNRSATLPGSLFGEVVGLVFIFSAFPAQAAAPAGERLYMQHCSVCHGPSGEGAMPGVPDLTPRPGRLEQPASMLVGKVMEGITAPDGSVVMPARGNGVLTRAQAVVIIEYMKRSLRQ